MRQVASAAIVLLTLSAGVCADDVEFFEAKIRPILVRHCIECHADEQEGGLRLDSRQRLLAGGDSGPAIVVGKPHESLLLQAVSRTHKKLKMPPGKPLAKHEVDALSRWVKNGAVWPATARALPRERMKDGITDEQRNWWSLQPVKRPDVPVTAEENPVDGFIAAKLAARKLKAAEQADARTLIRRATFDLVGLPPTPKEIDDFVRQSSVDADAAFRELVERLLDLPQYGERWGQHWLDLVRYADTAGDASDFPIPEAYKYRNYVIDAFNKDKPYDQFVREQIAGDLLPFENDDQRWEQTIATGYIAISRRIGVSPHNLKHITIEDTIDNLGKTFLGLTIGCARCHDHKFDPIPTEDYYALYGIFDSTGYPHAGAEHKPWRQDFVYRIGKDKSDKLLRSYRETLEVWNRKERAKLEEYRDFQRKPILDPEETREKRWQAILEMREQRRPYAEGFPDLEIGYAVYEGEPRDAHVQKAGDPRSRGDLVRRGFPQILGGQQLPRDAKGSGRRQLADWITDPANPRTARVMVNRIWHHHFGKGLVKTTSDFGVRGTPPTHAELLDFLASYFVGHDWSIKDMHRLIMLSKSYRRASFDAHESSAHDPENDLLWRADRRRLDAEQFRDSLLTFSGQLDPSPGGRHSFDHRLTYFYRQHEPFVGNFEINRRSVYMMRQRIQKNAYLDMFDGPDGNIPQAERKATTTSLQALYLMNSDFVHERADEMAQRLMSRSADARELAATAYETIFGRPADESELDRAEEYLRTSTSQLAAAGVDPAEVEQGAWAGYLRAMISSNEFMFVD